MPPFLTITLDNEAEAVAVLEFLQRRRKRTADDFNPDVPKEDLPFDQVTIYDRRYRRSSLLTAVEVLTAAFGDGSTFALRMAVSAMIKQRNMSQRMVQDALRYGIYLGRIRRVERGKYQAVKSERTDYRAQETAIVDIVTENESTLQVMTAMKMMSTISDGANLHVSSDGIRARYWNRNKTAMIDIFLPKAIFSVFKAQDHVRFGFYIDELKRRLQASSGTRIHISIPQDHRILRAGWQGDEHELQLLDFQESHTPFDVEKPLPPSTSLYEVLVSKSLLADILSKITVNDNEVTITCTAEKVGFSVINPTAYGKYKRDLSVGQELAIRSHSNVRFKGTFDAQLLRRFLEAADSNFAFRVKLELLNNGSIRVSPKIMIDISLFMWPLEERLQPEGELQVSPNVL